MGPEGAAPGSPKAARTRPALPPDGRILPLPGRMSKEKCAAARKKAAFPRGAGLVRGLFRRESVRPAPSGGLRGMAQAVKRNVTFPPMNPRACGGAGGGASGAHRGVFCSKWGLPGLSAGKKAASQGRGRVVPSLSSGSGAHAGGLAFSVSSALAAGRGGLQAQGRCCSSARGSGRAAGAAGPLRGLFRGKRAFRQGATDLKCRAHPGRS